MPRLAYWAIRRKSDGFYMPQANGRGGRGGSMQEPQNPLSKGFQLRLFTTEPAAKIALNAWLKGKWQNRVRIDFEGEEEHILEIVPQEGRNRDDMEIVDVLVDMP